MKVGIVVDSAGRVDEEVAGYKRVLSSWLASTKPTFYVSERAIIEEGTDLLVFDYGGMSGGYGDCGQITQDATRAVLRWAADNPSGLLLVTSSFSYDRLIERELSDAGLYHLPNVMVNTSVRYADWREEPTLPKWWLLLHGVTRKRAGKTRPAGR